MNDQTLSLLVERIRKTIRRDPAGWAKSCGIELRPYQLEIARAIKESVIGHLGLSFILILPRQSGKNELQAHLFAWLLFRAAPFGGCIVSVSPTYRPQTVNAMQRVRRSLDACPVTRGLWRASSGYTFSFGKARLQFLSGQGSARVVGATADLCLSVDEAQDIDPAKFEKDFDPMTASTNATRLFWGTAWSGDTLLARQQRLAQRLEEQDGRRRVFLYTADDVRRLVPAYGEHVDRVIAERGRQHPLVRSQYFCETIDSQSGLFNAARLALIFPSGAEAAASSPNCQATAFLIDVAGMDEARLSLSALPAMTHLENPGRDATTLTIVGVDFSTLEPLQRPSYHVLARHSWTGENHVKVFGCLRNLAEVYKPGQIVIDASGVGEGLWAMLDRLYSGRVLPVKFSAQEKSEIGWRFLSIVETGRFHDPVPTEAVRQQYSRCMYEILPGPAHSLRWGVPEGARGPDGSLIHDDHLMADALTAVLDRLDWQVALPAVVLQSPIDPLKEMEKMY
jgi:hypothetical protein